jgi:Spy/CpxP family protein refolding chaperone
VRRFIKITLFLLIFSSVATIAQQKADQLTQLPQEKTDSPKRLSAKILQELDLTPDQIQRIRAVNQKMRIQLRQALLRLKQANNELDEAMYANELNEATVMEKLRNLQIAQAEVTKLRIQLELEFRKILTSEQLEKFRRLRQQPSPPPSRQE